MATLPVFLPGKPMPKKASWAAVHGRHTTECTCVRGLEGDGLVIINRTGNKQTNNVFQVKLLFWGLGEITQKCLGEHEASAPCVRVKTLKHPDIRISATQCSRKV